MRVFVTGANGFIGTHLVRTLLRQGYSVRAFILPGTNPNPPGGQGGIYDVVEGDIRDSHSVAKAIKGCTWIFHLAAYCHLWAKNPSHFFTINVAGTQNILRAAKKAGVKKFIYTSTAETLFSSSNGHLSDESHMLLENNLHGPYAKSKWLAEQEVIKAARSLHTVIVHPTLPVGNGDTGMTPVGRMINLFLEGKLRFYYPTGFNFVDVQDVAYGHVLAAEKGRNGQRYLLGGENLTLADFLGRLSQLTQISPPRWTIHYPVAYLAACVMELYAQYISGTPPPATREGVRVARKPFYFSHEKAARELGYKPSPIDAALKEEVEFYLNRESLRVRRRRTKQSSRGSFFGSRLLRRPPEADSSQ